MAPRKYIHVSPATEFKCGNGYSLKYDEKYCEEMISFFKETKPIPMFEEFATNKNITTQTLRNWARKYPKFGAAYSICLEIQKAKLLSGGISGVFNPQIVKLFAINNLEMSDKTEQKVDANVEASGEFKVNITVLKPDKIDGI